MNPSSNAAVKRLPFRFSGTSWGYFKVWIVNILLTILTLGIYSAWAKVRNTQYFYGNTTLDNASFEYRANPVAILKGRLIAAAVFAVYYVSATTSPISQLAFMVVFMAALPWLIVRSLAFNARNSAYRNISFDFTATYGEAAKVFILWPFLMVFTLGLAYPYVDYRSKKFVIANSAYGNSYFEFDAKLKSFYGIYIQALTILLAGGIVASAAVAFFGGSYAMAVSDMPPEEAISNSMIVLLPLAVMLPVYLFVGAFVKTSITNHVWCNVYSDDNRFASTLETWPMLWIYLSNTLAIIFSLGLMIPWARVRMARYRIEHLCMYGVGNLDEYAAGQKRQASATAEGVTDLFNVDVGI